MKSRKLFMVASIAAVAGVLTTTAVPGCSSTTEEPATVTDAGGVTDTSVKPPKETGPEPEVDTGPAVCPPTTPITEADFPRKWMPPGAIESVCDQDAIDRLKAAFKGATMGLKFSDIKTTLGAPCAACVFSPVGTDAALATTWSVYVETSAPGAAAVTAIDNRTASCFARLTTPACGKARSLFEGCLRAACAKSTDTFDNCKTDSDVTKCTPKAIMGACKGLTDAYDTACGLSAAPSKEQDLIASCNIYASIAYSCAGGPDAGVPIDSSAP